ncbi:MAG TPA: family 16 glycoside hydrolase [Longilinea sp.]|nr:family 16 glycoside hydrolase [Longilinea sp.]
MKKLLPLVLVMAFILGACSSNGGSASDQDVQTRVAAILTQNAPAITETLIPSPTSFLTTVAPTVALASETPTVTPTPGEPTTLPTLTPKPTESLVPTDEFTATPTNAPTATFAPDDPRYALGTPTWSDSMANSNNWPTGDNDYSSITFKNGEMLLTGLTTSYGWRLSTTAGVLSNFYLEMTARFDSCNGTDSMGLFFRVPDQAMADRGYLFGLQCNGQYYLKRWDATIDAPTGTMYNLSMPHATDAYLPNELNRIGVLAAGNNIKLYINGVLVNEVANDVWTTGYFGVFVKGTETSNLLIHVTNVSYWTMR